MRRPTRTSSVLTSEMSRSGGFVEEDLVVGALSPRRVTGEARRQTQHPLPYGHPRKHVVDQVCGALDHAPPSTARTERTPLARKRDQPIEAARSTPKAGEATAERPTPKKVAELLLDEAR